MAYFFLRSLARHLARSFFVRSAWWIVTICYLEPSHPRGKEGMFLNCLCLQLALERSPVCVCVCQVTPIVDLIGLAVRIVQQLLLEF